MFDQKKADLLIMNYGIRTSEVRTMCQGTGGGVKY